jgi:hypothetical protein
VKNKSIGLLLNGDYNGENTAILAGCNFKLLEQDLKFSYYFIMDPIFFKNEDQLTLAHKERRSLLFDKILSFDKSFTLVVPRQHRRSFKRKFVNIEVEGVICRSIPNFGSFLDALLVNLGFTLSSINVIFAMITFSIQKGYTKILIYGANHDWVTQVKVDHNNSIIYTPSGYKNYEPTPLVYHNGISLGMSDFLKTQLKNFQTHDRLSRVASFLHVEIFNLSAKSFITSYNRKLG